MVQSRLHRILILNLNQKKEKEKEAEIPKTLLNWLGVTPGSEVWQASLHGHQK